MGIKDKKVKIFQVFSQMHRIELVQIRGISLVYRSGFANFLFFYIFLLPSSFYLRARR